MDKPDSPGEIELAAMLAPKTLAALALVDAMKRCGCINEGEHTHYCHEARDAVKAIAAQEQKS